MKKLIAILGVVIVILLIILLIERKSPVPVVTETEKTVEDASDAQVPKQIVCGDSVIEGNEECDGASLGAATCKSIPGFIDGTLSCTSQCTYDLSACEKECAPAWTCSSWSFCTGTQTRVCIDSNKCGKEESKPAESQTCIIPEAPKKTIVTEEKRVDYEKGAGQDAILLAYRTDEQDAHYKLFVDGTKSVEGVCSFLFDKKVIIDWVAINEENKYPAVYCYGKTPDFRPEKLCKRWTPTGITSCSYDSKLRVNSNFFQGSLLDEGHGKVLSGSVYNVFMLNNEMRVSKSKEQLFSMPARKEFYWKYYLVHNGVDEVNMYMTWQTELSDGSTVYGIGSNLFKPIEFMKMPPSIRSYSWPATEGSYSVMFIKS